MAFSFESFGSRVLRWVRGPADPPQYILTRWLFLRLLGFVYFFAFLSWWMQVAGLIGSHGLLPVGDYLQSLQRIGSTVYWQLPTLVWINSSDGFISLLCGAGVFCAVLVIHDILTLPALFLLWVLYLSQVYAGQDFMAFQWDILLVEVGFLAIFLAPLHIRPRWSRQQTPSRVVIWLFRILLFRLMFESGYVKLASGDQTWYDLTATTYHYWTQPLPSPLAWYMNQLPFGFHQGEVLFTFFVELIVPFLIFAPRRLRVMAAGVIATLQLMILLTGNYTFFNFLTISLCVLLLDDTFLRGLFPRRVANALLTDIQPERMYRRVVAVLVALLISVLNVTKLGNTFFPGTVPNSVQTAASQLNPLHLVNGYGLFASMTTTRPEIIIEGSRDGQTWLPYEFKYKAGDLTRSPAWVEPFQPRLDWQMWFAALEGSPSAWFTTLVKRLLQGTPEVLALLDKNPFPDQPPHFIRATLYNYTFTDAKTRQATGQWWQRKQIGEFMPPVSLDAMQG